MKNNRKTLTAHSNSSASPDRAQGGSTNYDLMFGSQTESVIGPEQFIPNIMPMGFDSVLVDSVAAKAKQTKQWVLVFIIGTKPCFYKFWGSIAAAAEAGVPYLIVDCGQHYDPLLTHGTQEFGYRDEIGIHLNVRGDLVQKSGELFFKMSWLGRYLGKKWPTVTAVPVVLGDTLMTSIVPAAWLFTRTQRSIQNEAGLRSMTPTVMRKLASHSAIPLDRFFQDQQKGPWERLTNEPFPEQYDTFTSAAGSQFLFAPTELNKKHLIQEGYAAENIFVIGGVVVDALELKRSQKPTQSIFQVYPALQKNRWIRIDIHRKENLTRRRFAAIIGAIRKLVLKGYYVNFVEMNATKVALEQYGLRQELLSLRNKKNYLHTPIWQEYSQVLEFYQSNSCLAALTDSGGLQEELNILGKICLTCRFNTDRPESVTEGRGNLLVPPISAEFIFRAVDHVCKSESWRHSLQNTKPLYGSRVGEKLIHTVQELMRSHRKPFEWAHERLGFWTDPNDSTPFL